jgi:hypothetical protein
MVFEDRGDGNVAVLNPTFEIRPTHAYGNSGEGLPMEYDEIQELMNEMWRKGFRPSSKATGVNKKQYEEHIADLRANNDKAMDLVYKLTDNMIK